MDSAEDPRIVETGLDLNRHLIQRPAATFFVRVRGDWMSGAGIRPGDLLVVDRAKTAAHGNVVVVVLDGELTVRRLEHKRAQSALVCENPAYRPVELRADQELEIWGVATAVIHKFE